MTSNYWGSVWTPLPTLKSDVNNGRSLGSLDVTRKYCENKFQIGSVWHPFWAVSTGNFPALIFSFWASLRFWKNYKSHSAQKACYCRGAFIGKTRVLSWFLQIESGPVTKIGVFLLKGGAFLLLLKGIDITNCIFSNAVFNFFHFQFKSYH